MLRVRSVGVVVGVFLSLVPSILRAQDDVGHFPNPSSNHPEAMPTKISKNVLIKHGFSFDDEKRDMCKISGPEGPCRVEAFVSSETTTDEASWACSKLDRASYVGRCVHGKLEGLSVVNADGSTKEGKEAFISYFFKGRMAYPAVTSSLAGDLNFGVQEQRESYGCVYFGKWDQSAERCGRFTKTYGSAFFTEANAQKLRDGTFDLSYYNAKSLDFLK